MNIALISPNYKVVSETFIQNHKNNLPGNIFYYYNGFIPTCLESEGNLLESYKKSFVNKIKLKLFYRNVELNKFILRKSFIDNKIDLVVAEFGITGSQVFSICENLKIPIITTWLGYEISQKEIIENNLDNYKKLLKSDNYNIVVSKSMIPKLVELGAGIEKIFYTPLPGNEEFKNCSINYNSSNIIAVGRFVDKKAPYNLILSMLKVIELHPNAVLNIVGEGPLYNTCKNLINYFKLGNNIILLGNKSKEEIIKLFENSRMFVQHSITAINGDQEGTPVVLLEASLAGLPIVSTKHSGIPDIIIDNETGFLVDENDIDAFAEKMILLLNDSFLSEQIGKKAKRFVSNNYSLENHLSVISTIINSSNDFKNRN